MESKIVKYKLGNDDMKFRFAHDKLVDYVLNSGKVLTKSYAPKGRDRPMSNKEEAGTVLAEGGIYSYHVDPAHVGRQRTVKFAVVAKDKETLEALVKPLRLRIVKKSKKELQKEERERFFTPTSR
jgi:hypothetical protein